MNSSFSLLLVDDDPLIADSLRLALPRHWKLRHVARMEDLPTEGFFHAAFVDLHLTADLKKAEGPEVIRQLKQSFPSSEVVAISGDLNLKLMEACLASGGSKFLGKPLSLDEVKATIEKIEALWLLREIEMRPTQGKVQWIGKSSASDQLRGEVARLRGEKGPILIEGETGTGKEIVSRLLHQQDPGRPFIAVNISAIPEQLFESEIFGHVKGAFTGADTLKIGLAEAAQGGDLFLDEIEALPLGQQVKLLRFLESGEIRRVGAKETMLIKTRVIAATNRNLESMAREGQFREDLLFRLRAQKILLPPLRERPDDIEELARFFLSQERPRSNKVLTPEALVWLRQYPWPGNVRELKRVCEQLALTAPLPMIRAEDVAKLLSNGIDSRDESSLSLSERVERFEASLIKQTLARLPNVDRAAESLQISRSSMYKKMKDYGIEAPA